MSEAVREERSYGAWWLAPWQAFDRIMQNLRTGMKRYGARNWEKGLAVSQYIDHAIVHIAKYCEQQAGQKQYCGTNIEEDEDHLVNAATNICMAIETLERIKAGSLPKSLDDVSGEKND